MEHPSVCTPYHTTCSTSCSSAAFRLNKMNGHIGSCRGSGIHNLVKSSKGRSTLVKLTCPCCSPYPTCSICVWFSLDWQTVLVLSLKSFQACLLQCSCVWRLQRKGSRKGRRKGSQAAGNFGFCLFWVWQYAFCCVDNVWTHETSGKAATMRRVLVWVLTEE